MNRTFPTVILLAIITITPLQRCLAQTADSETPAVESICDAWGFEGQIWGLCNAYCEAMDCDDIVPQASEQACERVLTKILNSLPEGMAFPQCQDLDEDGIPNGIDNCPTVFNPGQMDSDANGTGDVCEKIGVITGVCGAIGVGEITSDAPFFFINSLDFGANGYDSSDFGKLSLGAQIILEDPNQPGSNSIFSKAFSYELLNRCDSALLLKTEFEIIYDDPASKKATYLASIEGLKVGVLVTRGYEWPEGSLSYAAGLELLESKLNDVNNISAYVSAVDLWEKQILHIITYDPASANNLMDAYTAIPDDLKSNTILLITVTHGDDDFLYE